MRPVGAGLKLVGAPLKNKVIFVKPVERVFASQDEDLLRSEFDVRSFTFGVRRGFRHLVRQAEYGWWLLRHLPGSRLVFVWFADYHAVLCLLLARILRIPSLLVIGGFDAAKLPELDYGAHVGPFRSRIVRFCCLMATRILPVSNQTAGNLVVYTGIDNRGKINVIPNGADTDRFTYREGPRSGVLTAAICSDVRTLRVKGLDRFLEVAAALPDVSFRIVGVNGEALAWLSEHRTENVVLEGVVSPELLADRYAGASVICQLSRSESFGLAVAEAMSCGAIPVVTDETGMAELVDAQSGFVVAQSGGSEMSQTVSRALAAPDAMRRAASDRIATLFSLDRRRERLRKEIDEVINT